METLNRELFLEEFQNKGFYVQERAVPMNLVDRLRVDLFEAVEREAAFHGTLDHKDYGMLLACPIYGGAFLELLEYNEYFLPFDLVLGPNSIIYVYTSSCMPPHGKNYTSRIHVDRPHYNPGFVDSMGSLLLLDDFTENNGATWVLPMSHLKEEKPDEEYFYANASRIIAPKGSIFYFNLRLWHAGGVNMSYEWRNAIGIGMVRPYLKQRIDLPLALEKSGVDLTALSYSAKQRLGFYSIPPASLEEYYLPEHLRSYCQTSEWGIS